MNVRTVARHNFFKPALATLALACASSAVLAQDVGWYGGLGIGSASTDIRNTRIVSALQAGGYSTNTFATDERDTAFKLLGGYSFNSNFALEGSYFDAGDFTYDANLTPAATQRGSASVSGVALELVASWPLLDSLEGFVRAGINSARIEQDFSAPAVAGLANRSDRGIHPSYGAGLQYALTSALALRAELQNYHIDDNRITNDKLDTVSVGFVYRFGTRAPIAAPERPAAAPVAPTPAPSLPLEVTLSASTLFDFDRAELKPEGRRELDKLVADMDGLDYEVVIVTGHTDRIGTRSYNLALSQRRADTVKNHLTAAGIPAQMITTRGVNSDEPVTRPEQCTGPVSDTLKACLQPDRRVVVEVTGMRTGE